METAKLYADFKKIQAVHPLIHHITNAVTINDCANATLAFGGRPVMADSPEEAADMAALASALVINIGTLNNQTIAAMKVAGKSANNHHVPVIFDPVGAGATPYRRKTSDELLQAFHADIICGNMSEIKVLAGLKANARGVDSGDSMDDAPKLAAGLAKQLNSVVAVTGPVDVVSDGRKIVKIHNGHPKLADVTGTGCMTNSLIASFAAVADSPLEAAVGGIAAMGLSGEKANRLLGESDGIGSFKVRLFDAFSTLGERDFAEGAIEHVETVR